jgi:hypothetical protein
MGRAQRTVPDVDSGTPEQSVRRLRSLGDRVRLDLQGVTQSSDPINQDVHGQSHLMDGGGRTLPRRPLFRFPFAMARPRGRRTRDSAADVAETRAAQWRGHLEMNIWT